MPFLKFPDHYKCMYIDSDGGYISPRKLVKAQKLLAAKSGCEIVADIVQHITILKEPTECVSVVTDTHRVFQSKRVLIASGAFTSCRNLLPRSRLPNLQILGKTITLVCTKVFIDIIIGMCILYQYNIDYTHFDIKMFTT